MLKFRSLSKKILHHLRPWALLVVLVVLWYVAAEIRLWSPYLLPGPRRVAQTFWELAKNGQLMSSILISLQRMVIGFLISGALGIPLGLVFAVSPRIYAYAKGVLELLRNTPPLAFIPLLILWWGIGELSKIILIVLVAFFPMLINTIEGVCSVDQKLVETGQMFGFSRRRIFWEIVLPSAFPNIVAGMRIGMGYSWRAIIGAEMIASSSGLGYMILNGQQLSRTDAVLCGIVVIALLGVLGEALLSLTTKPFLKWRKNAEFSTKDRNIYRL